MNDNSGELHAVANRSARVITVIYVIIKQIFYVAAVEGYYWIPRGVAGIIMVAAVFYITKSKWLSVRAISVLTPLSLAISEIAVCALMGGDRLIYTFLIGCSLLSMMYLDTRVIFIAMSISSAILAFISLVLRVTLMGPGYTLTDEIFNLMGSVVINTIIFFICKYSVGTFKRLNRTGNAFDTVLDTTPSYMVIIDERAVVEYISRSLAEWLGISHKEYALRRPLMDICGTGEMKVMFQEVMESGEKVEKNYELTVGGIRYWFLMRSSLLGDGKVARTFELADITPIMEAKNEAEAATNAKSSFLANMSHEIRTPMNAIVGMTELLMLNPLSTDQMNQAVAIKGAAMSLLNIINDILDFSKIDAEKMEIIKKPFDFMSLINDTVNIINIKAPGSIAFTSFIAKDVPARVDGDELRIKQALLNILNNAVKFTQSGCVAMRVTSERMGNGLLKLIFAVEDSGIGMKNEEMDRLFNAFTQLDTHKNRDIVGTGLGLVITRRLIELMGGAISVDSTYGKGTVFSFYVICDDINSGHIVTLPNPQEYNVLCFEPNPYHAEALRLMLNDLGASYGICDDAGDFKQRLGSERYTHVLYDKSAMPIINDIDKTQNEVRYVLMKDVRDIGLAGPSSMISKPVLTTSLAQALKGEKLTELTSGKNGDMKLGAFKTINTRALLVDDNSVNLMVAEGMLRQYGIGVVTASGGQDGIDKIRTVDFDIVFMDHMMPGIDGIDATKAIRGLGGRYAQIPIIALSANAITGVEQTFIKAGMNGFISKPIVIKQLNDILLEHLPPEKIVNEAEK